MQDVVALGIAAAAAAWLGRMLLRRLFAPPCRPLEGGPQGVDGFVPLDALERMPQKKPGRSRERPDP